MITFQQFLELAESSPPERGKRRLAPKGPLKNKYSRGRQRLNTSNKVALKKAGFKRSDSRDPYPQDNESSSSEHHATSVATYKNQSDYATDNASLKIGSKNTRATVRPTSERVRKLKALRKQLGGDRTSKPVHDVSIGSDDERVSKNSSKQLISRGKSFKKEVRAVPDTLKKVGAKPGDKVASTPMGVMPGENRKEGAKKRDKIYTKELGSKMNPKTGKTMGTVRG
jgi:hypothetical protein